MHHIDQQYNYLKSNLREHSIENQGVNRTVALEIVEDVIKRQYDCDWYLINAEPLLESRSIASIIYIGSNTCLPAIRLKGQTVLFVHQKNKISRQEVPYLQILDFLVLLQKKRNADFEWLIIFLRNKIGDMTHEERKIMASLSRKYKPFTRVILAATLKNAGEIKLFSKIVQTISPVIIKKYRLITAAIFINMFYVYSEGSNLIHHVC